MKSSAFIRCVYSAPPMISSNATTVASPAPPARRSASTSRLSSPPDAMRATGGSVQLIAQRSGDEVIIEGNLPGCNSVDEIINPVFSDGFELPGNTITVVDNAENEVGEYTSIAIGTDGYPVISYTDRTAWALKVAKCHDLACSGGNETITVVDDPPGSVSFTSIAIGPDGFPAVAYNNSGSLVVVKCNDEACAGGGETFTTVDSSAKSDQSSNAHGDTRVLLD